MLMLLAVVALTGYLAFLAITHPIRTFKYLGFFIIIMALGLIVWSILLGTAGITLGLLT